MSGWEAIQSKTRGSDFPDKCKNPKAVVRVTIAKVVH